MPMFGPTFDDYYRTALEKVRQEILHESDVQILGSSDKDLANYYFQRYAIQPVVFDPDSVSYEIKKEVRTVPAHRREDIYQSGGDVDWEYQIAIISLPIEPNDKLHYIKQLSAGSWSSDGFEDRINFTSAEVSYRFDVKGYGFEYDENRIASEINTQSERMIKVLIDKNNRIESENINFLNSIQRAISEAKAKISSNKEKMESLTQKIKIPLKEKTSPNVSKVYVNTKNFVKVIKPTPKLPEEYSLDESVLIDILGYINNQCQSFEKAPGSYKSLREEELRDIILAALNGIFEGNATGETFIKKGKSDIHLRIEKGEILIFECKIWGGEKLYLETIDQLIGYVTWRQNYGVVIMFCKNKDYSKILDQVPGIVKKHSQFKSGFKGISKTHFTSEHTLPEDQEKKIKIHHLIYNLYSEP
jgi:hypothetical protein